MGAAGIAHSSEEKEIRVKESCRVRSVWVFRMDKIRVNESQIST